MMNKFVNVKGIGLLFPPGVKACGQDCRRVSTDAIRQGIVGMVGSTKPPLDTNTHPELPTAPHDCEVCHPCRLSRNHIPMFPNSENHSREADPHRLVLSMPGSKLLSERSSSRTLSCRSFHTESVNMYPNDMKIRPALEGMLPCHPPPYFTDTVPGKGAPPEVPREECCMSGCALCVWSLYAEDLKDYFDEAESLERVKRAINRLDNSELRNFLTHELDLR